MDRSTAILLVLGAYFVAMLGLGLLTRERTRDAAGFYLGGRTLGPWVAALAANASSSSAWSLVGVSGFAYNHGLVGLWLLPGCLGGFLLNWLFVAPRLRAQTGQAVTLTEFLAGPPGRPGRAAVIWFASLLTIASLGTYVAAQMQAAGGAFVHAFDTDVAWGVLLGAALTIAYTLLGGYLAASFTDMVQGLMMAGVAVVLPIAAVLAAGGPSGLAEGLAAQPDAFRDPFGGRTGLVAAGFALGLCGIGLGYPGQPHAVNKFMGMRPDASMAVARTVGIAWAVILYCGMLVLGWAARVLFELPAGKHEDVLYEASRVLLPAFADGVVLAAVLAAIMSTVDGQMLVCGSSITHDLGLGGGRRTLRTARLVVLGVGAGAAAAAIALPEELFTRVLFAWSALGSAFGPVLVVHLLRGPVRPWYAFAAMVAGASGALLGYYEPLLAPGFLERVASWLAALVIAWLGSERPAAAPLRQPAPASPGA